MKGDRLPDAHGLLATSIRRPVSVLVGVILTTFFGALALTRIPIQLTPDIAIPVVTVTTQWPGASPQEVESEILEPQEEALKSLSGLVRMEAEARLERGSITLELEVGTSIEESLVRVTNLLSQVPSYPEAAREPVISAADSSGPPLAVITITSEDRTYVGAYRTWIEERVQPRLERIDGVARVVLIGGQDREVEVMFDQAKLAARGLTISGVSAVIQGELTDRSAGDVTVGKRRFLVRTPLAPATPEGLGAVVLATSPDGAPVRLADVATVRFGLRKPAALVYSDDVPSIVFLLFREAGSNVLEVTRRIRAEVDRLQESTLAPRGLRLEVVSDQTGYIEGALSLVQKNLFIGGALAVVVLLLFLGSLRAAAVVSVAIPVCMLGTALGMQLFGRTINVVSLAGMAFAVGMVVDNAIVVLENIDTWRGRANSIHRAALLATREVWGAILASTLTTAVVFLPIVGWDDEVGAILRDIAVAISLAVVLSLVTSVLVIPSLAALVLSKKKRTIPQLRRAAKGAEAVRQAITDGTRWVVASRTRSAAVVGLGMTASVASTAALLPHLEYLPTGNRAFVFGILVPPPGYSVEEMGRIGERLQAEVVKHTGREVGGVPALRRSFFAGRPETAFMGAGVEDSARTREFLTWYRKLISTVPGMFPIATQASLFGRRIGGGRSVEVDLSGSDLVGLVRAGATLLGAIREAMPGSQVRPIPGLDEGAPEYHVEPRREEAAQVGLTGRDLGLVVDALVDGAIIGEYARPGEPKVDVVLSAKALPGDGPQRGLKSRADLSGAPVGTPAGQVVTLDSVARIHERLGPTVIRRIERSRALTLQVAPPDDLPLERAMSLIRDEIVPNLRRTGAVAEGIDVDLSGTAGQLASAKMRFRDVLLLALLISFLLMAALFEDFIAPVAVMVTVPLAGAGGVIVLRLVDRFLGSQTLDMLTALGFVILIGVVVNNAILVVDGSMARLREGADLGSAITDAVYARVRPIFMSALTSLAGLSPLVLFPGSGSELYRGVGAIVLGGLALSTVLTVFMVPAMFSLLYRRRRRIG